MIGPPSLPSRARRAARPPSEPGDRWYLLYAVLITLLIVGFPIVRALAHGLTHPDILRLLVDPPSGLPSLIVIAAVVAALVVGGTIGPAVLRPVLTAHLAGNHLSRARTLLRPFLAAATGLVMVCVLFTGTAAWALRTSGDLSSGGILPLLAGAACGGWLVAVAWLFGQAFGVFPRLLVAIMIVVLGLLLTNGLPSALTTGSWVGPPLLFAYGLPVWGAAAIASATFVPWMLTRLRGPELLEHAQRRDHAVVAGSVGEVGLALASFRALPWFGRRINAIREGLSFPLTIAVRDIIGGVRTPVRGATAVVGILLTAVLVVIAFVMPPELAWMCAVTAGVLGFASFGVLSDGFRGAAEGIGRPRLFDASVEALFAAHALVPGSIALLSGFCALVIGTVFGLPLIAGATACACSALLVLVRAADSARGPLPVRLLTPIPSPVGDAAGIGVMMWQVDGLVKSVALVVGSVYAVRTSPGALLAAAAVAAVLVVTTARRLRAG